MREWVDYHRMIGVSKFYIFDNNSSVPLMSILSDYIQEELVQYHYLVGKSMMHPQFEVGTLHPGHAVTQTLWLFAC